MQSIDTDVLVRILVNDSKKLEQAKIARQFAKDAGQLYVSQIVQVELVWVLDTSYGLSKKEILAVLKHLHTNEAFVLQNASQYTAALHLYQTTNANFSDCLIWAESHEKKCDVVTFDEKFSRLPRVTLLKPH